MNRLVLEGASYLQFCVGLLSLLAYIPQWKLMYSTKSSRNVSLGSWAIWSISSLIATFYALVQVVANGRGWALVFSASSNLLFVIVTLCLIAKYRTPKSPAPFVMT
ncbi:MULTISPECIES: PQ-loop domain-containing transporter [Deefgea]|uniref:PQ-loop repeat-containing protein n=1 Tax=Deefgea chitinilytica TaxID=570276 RepID=A0ABS2C8V7_9NEIS|nr:MULTISPECIES: PQ-loop domain-containing transporter [Deefgea]MBM5570583.1 hypothetical protein [Deefgea chitinilytica]MBM9887812.1 hypothetical protein [Deefgea sp. CFH1-16]